MKEKATYENGKIVSKVITYHENGKVQSETEYKNGLKNGAFKQFYTSGQPEITGNYRYNRQIGTWKYFDESGKIIKNTVYRNGIAVAE
ncbi:hypothetical protein AHMF7616_02277 [Adhaeribacter pallidiroseus]|uniref:Uncharacterized protein n=1 Tax=Adhaeribacter pallidiroseus TaxID=2072847 RepID=A0A369QLE6_9BACT|nr:hypothetical protein AHMF7616_02277 [Adhaeribacter pallidiroseus]